MKKLLETDYVHALQAKASLELPNLRLFRRNTGLIRVPHGVFRSGIPGQCDLYGIDRKSTHYEIEVKGVRTQFTLEQMTWRDWCRAWGVPWLLLRVGKTELPAQTIDRWIGEVRALIGERSEPAERCEEPRPPPE